MSLNSHFTGFPARKKKGCRSWAASINKLLQIGRNDRDFHEVVSPGLKSRYVSPLRKAAAAVLCEEWLLPLLVKITTPVGKQVPQGNRWRLRYVPWCHIDAKTCNIKLPCNILFLFLLNPWYSLRYNTYKLVLIVTKMPVAVPLPTSYKYSLHPNSRFQCKVYT